MGQLYIPYETRQSHQHMLTKESVALCSQKCYTPPNQTTTHSFLKRNAYHLPKHEELEYLASIGSSGISLHGS